MKLLVAARPRGRDRGPLAQPDSARRRRGPPAPPPRAPSPGAEPGQAGGGGALRQPHRPASPSCNLAGGRWPCSPTLRNDPAAKITMPRNDPDVKVPRSPAGAAGTAHISLRARRPRPPGRERDARRAHRRRQAANEQAANNPPGSAETTPRGAGTTAAMAPSQSRSGNGRGGTGARPGADHPRCARRFRINAGSCSVAISRSRPPQCGHARTSKLQRRPGEESATIHRRASPSALSCGGRCRHLPTFGRGTVGRPQRVRTAFNAHSRTSPG